MRIFCRDMAQNIDKLSFAQNSHLDVVFLMLFLPLPFGCVSICLAGRRIFLLHNNVYSITVVGETFNCSFHTKHSAY